MGGRLFRDARIQLLHSPADYLCGYFTGDALGVRTKGLKCAGCKKAELDGSAFLHLEIFLQPCLDFDARQGRVRAPTARPIPAQG